MLAKPLERAASSSIDHGADNNDQSHGFLACDRPRPSLSRVVTRLQHVILPRVHIRVHIERVRPLLRFARGIRIGSFKLYPSTLVQEPSMPVLPLALRSHALCVETS